MESTRYPAFIWEIRKTERERSLENYIELHRKFNGSLGRLGHTAPLTAKDAGKCRQLVSNLYFGAEVTGLHQ